MKFYTRLLLLLFVFSSSSFIAKGLTASFTADVTSGCAPLVVHFTNTSTGATSYHWDLGNGTTSTLTNVSGTYLTPGTYTVTLIAYAGGVSVTTTMTITVYPSPTVSFTASSTHVCPGAPITFTSSTIGGVPGPMTLTWDFGDGSVGSGPTPTHAYTSPGLYNVTLVATNSMGCTATLKVVSYIDVYTPATISITVNSTVFCKAPGHAVFTNYTTGFPGLTYAWTFGDGGISAATNPTHDYLSPGAYTVELTVTDGHGCMDSTSWSGYITVDSLKAAFTPVTTACVNSSVTFINTSSTHISSKWTFGDGGTDTANDGTHIYTTPGTYTVTLIIFDGSCFDTVSHIINILAGPVTSFTQNPYPPCPAPVAITFTGTVPSGSTVTWLFGDGGTGSGATITHTYGARGIYDIEMITTDAFGCVDTISQIDSIHDIIKDIIDTPSSGCVPLTVHFIDSVMTTDLADTLMPPVGYPYPITSYTWNFGDGSTGTGRTPVHTYTAAGTYWAVLTILTSNGCTQVDSVEILAGSPPVITASVTPTHICFRDSVILTVTIVSGPVDDYVWDFGSGGSTIVDFPLTSVEFHFFLPGTFTATVTPYYHGCAGPPYVVPYAITVDSPMARMGITFNCYPRTKVDFADSSLGDDSHLWIFGDGTTDTAKDPVHFYPAATTYTVTLTTYNKKSGCRDTIWQVIDLTKPIPDFTADHIAVCQGGIVHFTPTVTGGTAIAYYWFVDGVWLSDTGHVNYLTEVLKDTFTVVGLHTVSLVIADQFGCLDTVTKTNYITCALPTVSFTDIPPSGCAPLAVTFTDKSTDAPGVSFVNYLWNFGDGGGVSVSTPVTTHTYTVAGSFTVKEIVTDNIGCVDSAASPAVAVFKPTAVFTVSNNFPCIDDSIYFTNASVGIVSSLWIFGDGTTSTSTSSWHTYPAVGYYTVELVVTDAHGCTDTSVQVNYIDVTQPLASFYMSDSFSICPPLTVTFYNTSTGAVGYNWAFGDGNTSVLTYPTDLYIKPGLDTVMLIATNSYGCSDTAYGHVNLYGYAGAFSYTPDSGCAPLTVHFKADLLNVPTIVWDFADGNTAAAAFSDSITHVYLLPGEYLPKLVLSDNTGCSNSSTGIDTIKVDAIRPGFTTVPNPVCQDAAMYFKDTSGSYFATPDKWLWIFTNGDTSTSGTPAYFYRTVGTFPVTLHVTDSWGCTDSVTQNVTVYPPPVITVSPDTIICLTDGATLTGYGGVSYTWSPTATVSCTSCNPTIASPDVVTTYTVTGADEHGCMNTDTVTVFLKTKTVSVGRGDTSACEGVAVPLYDSGATKFNWQPQGGLTNPTIADPYAAPRITTTYTVIAQLASCLPDTNYITVTVYPLPTVYAGPDQTVMEGTPVQLQATGTLISSANWGEAPTLSCDSCLNPVANMFVTTTYVIGVSDSFGCLASDSVTIHVFCDKSQIFMPNTFTPNGDGQDDVYYPRGKGIGQIKSFRIYNRWGQMLFERTGININDAANAWDGSYMGGAPRPDVYVWVLDAVCESGEPINLKGDVTIIR